MHLKFFNMDLFEKCRSPTWSGDMYISSLSLSRCSDSSIFVLEALLDGLGQSLNQPPMVSKYIHHPRWEHEQGILEVRV